MKTKTLFVVASVAVPFLWILNWVFVRFVYSNDEGGTFGDMFGAVNALFSGLAFAGLIYTILKQQEETAIHSYQKSKDTFETTFFKLIELHRNVTGEFIEVEQFLDPISSKYKSEKIRGTEVIARHREKLCNEHLSFRYDPSIDFKSFYQKWDEKSNHQFDRYLSSIDAINDFVSTSKLSSNDREFYIRVFALQLTEAELAFFFYYYTLSEEKRCIEGNHKKGMDVIDFVAYKFLYHKTHLELYYSKEYLTTNGEYDGHEYQNLPLGEI